MQVTFKQMAVHRVGALCGFALHNLAGVTAGRGRPLRLLLAGDLKEYTSEQQYAPFLRYRKRIRDALGVELVYTDIGTALTLLSSGPWNFEMVGVKLSFRTEATDARRIVEKFRARVGKGRLLYFDGDDDLAVQWPDVVPLCDLYIKKHVHRDRSEYERATVGKTNLTDHVASVYGVSFEDDIIPANSGLAAEDARKIRVLANIAEDDKIRTLHDANPHFPENERTNDIVCRATVNPESWIFHLRKHIDEQLAGLSRAYSLLLPSERVPQARYYEEMLSSRLCVSPFGYGEICWRDFEAVLCGAAVVKPDMSHVETHPDIFVPHETYVPVRWDFADLAEKCHHYLSRPDECRRIARNAHRALVEQTGEGAFVRKFGQIVGGLGLRTVG